MKAKMSNINDNTNDKPPTGQLSTKNNCDDVEEKLNVEIDKKEKQPGTNTPHYYFNSKQRATRRHKECCDKCCDGVGVCCEDFCDECECVIL
mmetsp:Transcript_9623/g.10682  ORF Transcript_9623/g.10682 Transcript_9623/m.10682 type:complete len:92 (+) Transcript_9623:1-276(+)